MSYWNRSCYIPCRHELNNCPHHHGGTGGGGGGGAPVIVGGSNINVTGTTGGSYTISLQPNIVVTSVSCTSDARKKENIRPIENSDEILEKLDTVWYKWRDSQTDTSVAGVIAQNVQTVLPGAVAVDSAGMLSVDYNQIIALLLADNRRLNRIVQTFTSKA
jgi:hypothetical protein